MMEELENAFGHFLDTARARARAFDDDQETLWERRATLLAREEQLDEREARVQRRESDVDSIHQLAAYRQVEIASLKDVLENEIVARRNAEREKTRLESVISVLMTEKAELKSKLEAERKADVTA
jgi:hypothetical protein